MATTNILSRLDSLQQEQPSLPDNLELNMTRTKLELEEIETLTHLVRARAVELGPFQGLYKNILSKLNKMFDEEYAVQREKKGGKEMKAPENIYVRLENIGSSWDVSTLDNGGEKYIRKDIVDETIKTAEDHAYFAGQEKFREKLIEWAKENIDSLGRLSYGEFIDKLNSM